MAVLFDRHIIEIKRYGPATGQPQTPRTVLMNAVFGRGKLTVSLSGGRHLTQQSTKHDNFNIRTACLWLMQPQTTVLGLFGMV